MKKSILCSLIMLFSMSLFAQEDDVKNDYVPSNEIKINALYTVIGAFDITYERLLNEESGVGLNIFLPYDEDIKDDINYYISPYYRLYFGKKYASGFFIEGFGLLSSVNRIESSFIQSQSDPIIFNRETQVTDFALGIGAGGKWIANNGFVGEIGFGIGRNITDTADNGDDFVGKIAISVGYRF